MAVQLEIIIVAAILIEAVVNGLKLTYDAKKRSINPDVIVSLIIGVGVAVAGKIDFFAMSGIKFTIPYFGAVLSGVIMARGSNYTRSLVKLIRGRD